MEKMTIHRALSELKLIDAKIEKAIEAISPTGMHQKGKLINGQQKEEDLYSMWAKIRHSGYGAYSTTSASAKKGTYYYSFRRSGARNT